MQSWMHSFSGGQNLSERHFALSIIFYKRKWKIFRANSAIFLFSDLFRLSSFCDTLNIKSLNDQGNSLSNEGIFMILLPQYFPWWIKRYVLVHFSKENTVKAGLEGNSLVKSTRYLIITFFQGGIFRPNRPVLNLMIPYRLDTLQFTQEKERKLSDSVFYWVIQK